MKEENNYSKEYIDSLKFNGPILVTIPEYTYNSCARCKHYDSHMAQSGFNPIYSHNCVHPDLEESRSTLLSFGQGNLQDDKTPSWCPYMKQENDKDN